MENVFVTAAINSYSSYNFILRLIIQDRLQEYIKLYKAKKEKFIYLLRISLQKTIDTLTPKDRFVLNIEKKNPFLVELVLLALGYSFKFYQDINEKFRVKLLNFLDYIDHLGIVKEIIIHSRQLIILLFISLFGLILPYYFVANLQVNISNKVIETLSGGYVGAITAILGIIFGLYAIGFQTYTAKFSSEVTDFINQEKVGRFFFKLLVFTGLFSLGVFLLQSSTQTPLLAPFIFCSILVLLSLLGILIYKDDYITKLKPRSVFQLLYNGNIRSIRLVNAFNSPKIKNFRITHNPNIHPFKLSFQFLNSWSILSYSQKQVDNRLNIHKALFDDLIKENLIEDASFGIVALGYFLLEYTAIKEYIDKERAWWFPTYSEKITADSPTTLGLKTNYESKGIGILSQSKKDYNWLENKILSHLEEIQNNTEVIKEPIIAKALIYCYELILTGKYEQTQKGLEKNLRGIYELQNFELTTKVFDLFFKLVEKIPQNNSNVLASYINCLGQIKTTIVDGFSWRKFPGVLEEWQPKIASHLNNLYNETKIADKQTIVNWKLPHYFFSLFSNYQESLTTEKAVEDRIITPKDWIKDEIFSLIQNKEKEILQKHIRTLLENLFTLTEKITDETFLGGLVLIFFHLCNQLISQELWSALEGIIKLDRTQFYKVVAKLSTKNFMDLELREPIEYGLLNALVLRNRQIFNFYLRLFFLSQIHIASSVDRTDTEQFLKVIRRPMMVGGIAYLISELDQDRYWINEILRYVEALYPASSLGEMYELTNKLKVSAGFGTSFRIIAEEENRYRWFYRRVIDSISQLPPDFITHGTTLGGSIFSTQTVKHPSKFIKRIASFNLSDMYECSDGYIEWLQQRDEVKEFLKVLIKIIGRNKL